MRITTTINLKDYQKKNQFRFNGLREYILKRDNYTCIACGMPQEEHIKKWGKGLTINHKDGNGRNSKTPNNNPSNLETLCLRCHGLIDCMNDRWKNYFNK